MLSGIINMNTWGESKYRSAEKVNGCLCKCYHCTEALGPNVLTSSASGRYHSLT